MHALSTLNPSILTFVVWKVRVCVITKRAYQKKKKEGSEHNALKV